MEDRIEHIENQLAEVQAEVHQIADAQETTNEVLEELRPMVGELAAQTTLVMTISASMLKLHDEVTKWAAAGALAGSVVLFIAVRALGF